MVAAVAPAIVALLLFRAVLVGPDCIGYRHLGDDGQPASQPQQRPSTLEAPLGFRPDVQFAPFYLAQQEGFFPDAGLEVTIEHARRPT